MLFKMTLRLRTAYCSYYKRQMNPSPV